MKKLARHLARRRRAWWVRKIRQHVLTLHVGLENRDYQLDRNGEGWVLQQLAKAGQPRVVFDVGAHHGQWTRLAATRLTDAAVHAFEIVPDTCAQLRQRCADATRVTVNNVGLSDEPGEMDVYCDPNRDSKATVVARRANADEQQRQTTRLPVTTGEAYCREAGVDHIDMLKLDVEGHEPAALRGFEPMLRRGAIDVIQFEYGYVNIDTKFLLKDFYEYLEPFGMAVGKIYPDHVDLRPYRYEDENFYGPNYLAVHRERDDLIAALTAER